MTEEKKKELFPYFAYIYSKELNPERYGNAQSYEEWAALLQDAPQDAQKITQAASELPDEEWQALEVEYNKSTEQEQKTNYLKELKKGGKMKKSKKRKCSCGCDLVDVKAKGGKMVKRCSCGCGAPDIE